MTAPTRIGIIDMGSNAIRFQIAETTGGAVATLESHRLPVRLGREVFQTGQIPEETISAVVDGFRRFRASCERLQVRHVRAIATSAMRDAHNRDVLVDRLETQPLTPRAAGSRPCADAAIRSATTDDITPIEPIVTSSDARRSR
jgi:exopolyphosphatase/pppGpp-phosphohydrolase